MGSKVSQASPSLNLRFLFSGRVRYFIAFSWKLGGGYLQTTTLPRPGNIDGSSHQWSGSRARQWARLCPFLVSNFWHNSARQVYPIPRGRGTRLRLKPLSILFLPWPSPQRLLTLLLNWDISGCLLSRQSRKNFLSSPPCEWLLPALQCLVSHAQQQRIFPEGPGAAENWRSVTEVSKLLNRLYELLITS